MSTQKIEKIHESGVETAKKIRKALKAAFPNVKFSVRSDYNSVRISWIDACTTSEVEAITNKFSSGSFNGMEDIYEYSYYEYEGKHYCGAKYIFVNRDLSPEYLELLEEKAEIMGFIKEWGTYQQWQLNKAELALKGELTLSTPQTTTELTTHGTISTQIESNEISVNLNDEKKGIEIQFTSKPSDDILESLRANGFKYYHKLNKKWIAKQSPERIAFGYSLIPSQSNEIAEPEQMESVEPAEAIQETTQEQTTAEVNTTTEQQEQPTNEQNNIKYNNGKIDITHITIERVEGLAEDCKAFTVYSFLEADNLLKRMAKTAPNMGYDKTDFTVFYSDGTQYNGRFDLQNKHMFTASLSGHMLDNLNFHAGLYKPSHMSDIQYKQLLDMYGEESKQECIDYLNKYYIPTNEPIKPEPTPTKQNKVVSLVERKAQKEQEQKENEQLKELQDLFLSVMPLINNDERLHILNLSNDHEKLFAYLMDLTIKYKLLTK